MALRSLKVSLFAVFAAACGGGESGETTTAPVKDPNIVGASGGTVAASNGAASLSIPPGALTSDVKITVAAVADPMSDSRTGLGTPHEFGPEGTKFSQPVTLSMRYDRTKIPAGGAQSEIRVAQLTEAGWIPVESGFVLDSVNGTVKVSVTELGTAASAGLMSSTEGAIPGGTRKNWHRRRSRWTSYYPPADPCQPVALGEAQTVSGQLLSGDCVETGNNGRRTDYYTVTTNAQTVLSVQLAGAITGPFGLAAQGLSAYSSSTVGSTLSTLVPAGTWRVFVTGTDSTTRGAYTLTTSTTSLSARSGCENLPVVAGQSIVGTVQATDCSAPVPQNAFYPAHRGKTFYFDLYRVRLFAGKTYNLSVTHSGANANACLVVWQNNQIVASVLQSGPSVNPKTLSITPAADLYYSIEVESCSTTGDAWSPAASMPYSLTISN